MIKEETKYTFCRICEALCGLEVKVKDGEVESISPDKNHVATRGFSCVKGLRQHEMYNSPDRLLYPQKLVDGKHERVSWKTADNEIGQKVKEIIKNYSADSIAMYVGTAAGFGVLHPAFAQGFMTGVGSKSMFSSATQDCSNKFATARHMYGFPFTQPFPDIENIEFLVIVGANPTVSKWSFLQVPNPNQHIKEIKARGGEVYVIDPRKTDTAKTTGKHIFIRPATDIFFYLSLLNEIKIQNGIDWDSVNENMSGIEELLEFASKWPADKTSAITGIDQNTISDLASRFLKADGAALYSSTGVNMGGNGALAFWIQEAIIAVTGNLDRKGGTLVGHGIMDFIKFGVNKGVLMRNDRTRVGDFESVNDAFPGGILADEILTPGKKQIRALFVTGGNPLITMANSERLKKAFQSLELLVCLDILPGETCSVANYVLPCTDPLQRPDLPFIFPLMLGLQTKPYLQATQSVTKRKGEQRDEASIYVDLARASGVNIFRSKIAQKFFEGLKGIYKIRKGVDALPQETLLNLLLISNKQKSFNKLLKNPHGLLRERHEGKDFIKERIYTADKKISLAPEPILKRAETLESDFEEELKSLDKFKLITKRAVTTHNSWTHNHDRMVKGGDYTNYLYMHSRDMDEVGLNELDMADVTSKTATVRLPVKSLDELLPRTVALPHGWGHQHAKGLSVASKTKGVNVNILAADGAENVDPFSGMSRLTGINVEIKPASGPQAHTWSGLPEN